MLDGRSVHNAPPAIRERGGVAMSLWMTGANETDCYIVAQLSARTEQLLTALEDLYSVRFSSNMTAIDAAHEAASKALDG